jgi:isoquinoline 1-oxidoreductase
MRSTPGVVAVIDDDFAGVAAATYDEARDALAAITATWTGGDNVDESDLESHLRAHPRVDGIYEHATGNVDEAFDAAAVRVTQTYATPYVAHAPMETRAAVAHWHGDRLTVWTGTQRPFGTRQALANAFGIDETRVRVIVPDTGTGFGGKHDPETAISAARLAQAAHAPVKVHWTREEEFTHAYFRPAAVIDVRVGATSDGDITAWDFVNVNSGAAGIQTPYAVANQRVRFQPAASPLRQGAYRALASTANHFARECAIDELAHELRVDPLEFRLRNLGDDRMAAVLRAAAEQFGWADRPRGAGIATGTEKGGRVATCVLVRVDGNDDHDVDNHVTLLNVVTAFECGAIIDADNLRSQVTGATIMGLSGALYEAVHFDAERILNPRFSEYRVARFADIPPIDVVLVDRPDLPSAGAGEAPIIAIAPALANAIFDATGRRVRTLPLLPFRD